MRSWTRENTGLVRGLAETAALRSRIERAILAGRTQRKYDPRQPRVPAGKPDGGQWTSEIGTNDIAANIGTRPAPYTFASRGSQSAAYCWNQMQIDMLFCTTLRPAIIRACRAQAMERYAACLAGKPLPSLQF